MDRTAIEALVQRRTDAINRRDAAGMTSVYAVDCVVESPLAGGTIQGRQTLTKLSQTLFDAFPDLTVTVEDLVIDDLRVAVSGVLEATYSGGFMGLAPSGNRVRVPLVMVSHVRDGAIVRERRAYDLTGMLVQAGVLKARSA